MGTRGTHGTNYFSLRNQRVAKEEPSLHVPRGTTSQAGPALAHGCIMGREISLGIAGGWNRSSAGGGVARPGQTRSALGPSVYRLLRAKNRSGSPRPAA